MALNASGWGSPATGEEGKTPVQRREARRPTRQQVSSEAGSVVYDSTSKYQTWVRVFRLADHSPSLIPYPPRVVNQMSHQTREKIELISRTKKLIGQLESVHRALEEDAHCAEVLQRLAAARGAINSLMGELLEDHILNHMPRKTKSSAEAAEDLIEIVRTYLK
jgi:DNA-binding FrmR family transcriptional regulator